MRISLILLLFLALISILFINFIWVDEPEFWRFGAETGEIVFGLSIGYIAAFIFYVIDVWLPIKDERKKINDRLAVPLSRLLNNMKMPLLNVYQTYGEKSYVFENITEEINNNTVSKVDLINHEAPMIIFDLNKSRSANYGEYLINHIEDVNKYIEKVFKFPVPLDIDLIEILDDIETSSYHEVMISAKGISQFRKDSMKMEGTAIKKPLYEYYSMYYKLKKYMIENNIKLTIDNL